MRFWDEKNRVGHMVIQSLEEGAFAADRAAHDGLVCWEHTQDGPEC